MTMELPFTVSELTARGETAFLYEWLTLHTEAGVGVFISDETSVFHEEAADVRGVRAQLWLAPFDVGVSQHVQLEIAPLVEAVTSSSAKFYEVKIKMHRQSGQKTAWLRGNRAFIGELRKQFLVPFCYNAWSFTESVA